MSWSQDQISVLINRYREHPILYDTKHMLYHNKVARSDALQQMMNDICKIRPNTTVEMIKSKLNSLKTQSTVKKENLQSWVDLTDTVQYLHDNSEEEELSSSSSTSVLSTSDSSSSSKKRTANQVDEVIKDILFALTQPQRTEDDGMFSASSWRRKSDP